MPLLGLLAGGVAKKLAGKALRWATRGRLIGQGGGRAIAGRAVGALGAAATASEVVRAVRGRQVNAFSGGGGKVTARATMDDDGKRRYRRMNVGNGRALRRAVRRVEMFERMARRVFTVTDGTLRLRKRRKS